MSTLVKFSFVIIFTKLTDLVSLSTADSASIPVVLQLLARSGDHHNKHVQCQITYLPISLLLSCLVVNICCNKTTFQSEKESFTLSEVNSAIIW